jgi:hypothetical protein
MRLGRATAVEKAKEFLAMGSRFCSIAARVQPPTNSFLQARLIRGLVSVVAVFLLLLVTFFAANDHAHEALHADGHVPEHNCVISLVAKGHLTGFTAPIVVQEALPVIPYVVPRCSSVIVPARSHLLPPSCVPPTAV